MRRAVITGMGIVSSLGDSLAAVLESLRHGRSGIRFHKPYKELGLRAQIGGFTRIKPKDHIEKKNLRFMGDAAAFAAIALEQAITDAGLREEEVSHPRTGLIIGSGGTSAENVVSTADVMREKGLKRLSPFMVPRTMSSTVSACLTNAFHIKGLSYSISSACATGSHCIGTALEQIQLGKQDIVFAGGSDEEHWSQTAMFDAMGALSSKRNDDPTHASRPYDADRDGFVIAGGGGMLVLEDYDHAVKRGARIHAELLGYGVTSDGADMVAPSGEGAVRCMRMALEGVSRPLDYLNTHGTSTPLGDIIELEAIRTALGDTLPPISSTKALSGHSLGAASVHEAIYCLLMMRDGFIAGSANIETLDEGATGFPIVQASRDATLDTVMSNSFGFGGTNASLVFGRV